TLIKYNDLFFDIQSVINLNNMYLEITKRFLDNGDLFVFFEIDSPVLTSIAIDFQENITALCFDHLYIKPQFDKRYGENKISGPLYYLTSKESTAIISKIYYYKTLVKEYRETEKSVLYELISEESTITIQDTSLLVQLNAMAPKCSFSICLSKDQLFLDEKNKEDYFKFYFESLKNNSVLNSYFILKSGTYTKLPYSIEPFTTDGYGYSLHHSSKKELIPFLYKTQERYFYNMIVNAIMQAFLYQKHENGVFYTPYTSTWLKNDTGIVAPYIDTRLNETFNLMLKDFIKAFPDKGIIDNTCNYMDFIVSYKKNGGQVYEIEGGTFFPDYFRYNLERKTHASLNHQLGIANGMFNQYLISTDTKYLKIFTGIIRFLESTWEQWLKENHDLYYGIKQEETHIVYYGDDYIYVTLIDLLRTQLNLLKLYNKRNTTIDKLIKSKLMFLDANHYGIMDDNAILAPGEGIHSRVEALKLHKEVYG
ncbi:MAG: hypothetical protein ACRDDX_11950, partial [Cellulosilyticaceae bacterium]